MGHDIVIHMVLEGLGAFGYTLALKQCKHFWHRAATWLVLALIFSYATVQMVG
jgi:hypothetical protein